MLGISQKAEDFVFNLFKDNLSASYIYHNFNHTLRVVSSLRGLLEHTQLSDREREILEVAAWLHDTGYTISYQNHEEHSQAIAREFLTKLNLQESLILQVEDLIKATHCDCEPQDVMQSLLKDADASHLGDANYIGIAELLRSEWSALLSKTYSDLEWASLNRDFLLNKHRYFSAPARALWQKGKEDNIIALQKKIQKLDQQEKEKAEKEFPSRGVDTMFRVTLNNHTRLSEIADSKANILLSVNAVLISIVLSVLVPKLDSPKNYHLIVPTFIMLASGVITIIFAILSTRPKVTSGTFTREELTQKKVNILFFGNFFKMPQEEYVWAMNELMKDRDGLYNALIRDLYYLGLVLNRKYTLLRITYNVFMFGIIISVVAFVWALIQFNISA